MARSPGRCTRGERLRVGPPQNHSAGLRLAHNRHSRADGAGWADQRRLVRSQCAPSSRAQARARRHHHHGHLSTHRRSAVRDRIETAGATSPLLPPYSSDLTPIEKAFPRLKAILRKTSERTLHGLWNDAGIDVFWFSWPTCLADAGEGEPRAAQFAWTWCPDCMMEGHEQTGQDFMRMEWCFATITLCVRHQRPLLNHCLCGSRERPVHVATGKGNRLCCSQCGRLLAGQEGRRLKQESPRTAEAASLQLAFEQDLLAALHGHPVSGRWCGATSPAELLVAFSDIADVLCAESGHRWDVPLDAFDTCFRYHPRFQLPDVDHKLSGLSSDGRRQVIAVVLTVIGAADICAVMTVDQRPEQRPIHEWLQQWAGSLEWLIHFIRPAYRRRLYRRAEQWPPQLRARYDAGVRAMS